MPFFRVEIKRHVSRVVELRQTSFVRVEALSAEEAASVAESAILDDEYEHYFAGWNDDNMSRQSSNDEETSSPKVIRSMPCSIPWRDPWMMKKKETPYAE